MSQRQREEEEISERGIDAVKADRAALQAIRDNQDAELRNQMAREQTRAKLDREWVKQWKVGNLIKIGNVGDIVSVSKITALGQASITGEDVKTRNITSWNRYDAVSCASEVEAVIYRMK